MALHRLFHHLLVAENRGLVIQPDSKWDGPLNFLFEILGISDANFAAHIDDRKSISGWSVYLNSAQVREKSRQQNCVILSVTKQS